MFLQTDCWLILNRSKPMLSRNFSRNCFSRKSFACHLPTQAIPAGNQLWGRTRCQDQSWRCQVSPPQQRSQQRWILMIPFCFMFISNKPMNLIFFAKTAVPSFMAMGLEVAVCFHKNAFDPVPGISKDRIPCTSINGFSLVIIFLCTSKVSLMQEWLWILDLDSRFVGFVSLGCQNKFQVTGEIIEVKTTWT